METNEQRRARLEAMANGGSAGVDAYNAALARQQDQQRQATDRVLQQMSTEYGLSTPAANYEQAVTAGRYAQPAWGSLAAGQQAWSEQVPIENLAISKLMADNAEAIADMQRESAIGQSVASERTNVSIAAQAERDRMNADIERLRNEASIAAAQAEANLAAAQQAPQPIPTLPPPPASVPNLPFGKKPNPLNPFG